ncbi:MAG: alpha/beta hydrolase [Clostridia bacterium]|nr:alpha/beta hydrolase [Clostridia bacterium]
MKKSTKVAVATAAGVAASAAVSYTITRKLVELAIYRQKPKKLEQKRPRVSRANNTDEFLAYADKCASELAEKENIISVNIRGRDGVYLAGHWYPCEGAKRIIVAMHGWRSAWNYDFSMIADFWHREGCSVLFAEQRGQNNSGGNYITFGHLERYDCLDWVNYVNENYNEENLPIYLAGISMGASTVLMTASLDLPDNVRGIMSDCGFTSAYDIWSHVVSHNLHIPYGLHGYMIDEICKKKLKVDSRNITTLAALNEARVPVAFIHGSDDRFVPVGMTYKNYKTCSSPKELLIVPGADHGQSYYTEREKYEDFTRAFWAKYDKEKWTYSVV